MGRKKGSFNISIGHGQSDCRDKALLEATPDGVSFWVDNVSADRRELRYPGPARHLTFYLEHAAFGTSEAGPDMTCKVMPGELLLRL